MNKFYAVAFFYSAQEIGIDADVITEPFIYRNTAVFNNKTDQLNCYANTMCPASQLLEANTEKELKEKFENYVIILEITNGQRKISIHIFN